MSSYWTSLDLDAGLCRVDDIGRVKPTEVVEPERITHTSQQLVEVALHALVRAAQQTRDPAVAVKAANSILDRVLGRIVAPAVPQQPATPAGLPSNPDEWPDWMDRDRLSYQRNPLPEPEGDAQETRSALPPAHPTSLPVRTLPESPTVGDLPPKPALRAVPKFYDSPTRPAT